MKSIMLFVYRLFVVAACVAILLMVVGNLTLNAAKMEYDMTKDTRTTWNKVVHPFTSDMEFVFQKGGGLDRANTMFGGLR